MGYHPKSKRMMLLQTQPGITVEHVLENTGFKLLVADDVTENQAPTEKELRVLREEVDKTKFYI
jgi:glutaconate CoA-transferase subunit B